jgi:hypothetical protein
MAKAGLRVVNFEDFGFGLACFHKLLPIIVVERMEYIAGVVSSW